jgi:hypothetical protein
MLPLTHGLTEAGCQSGCPAIAIKVQWQPAPRPEDLADGKYNVKFARLIAGTECF